MRLRQWDRRKLRLAVSANEIRRFFASTGRTMMKRMKRAQAGSSMMIAGCSALARPHRRCLAILGLIVALTGGFAASATAQAVLTSPQLATVVAVKSWKALRDERVVKQDLDYSCGAASLATILEAFYGKAITEEQILKDMATDDAAASFDDMAKVLAKYGFKGVGVALGFEQLQQLRIPAVVYLRYRGDDHFSVLRGVSQHAVRLADPSWGNRHFSKAQFLQMWHTRDDPTLKGKVLLVLPAGTQTAPPAGHADFFARPQRPILPEELLLIRQL